MDKQTISLLTFTTIIRTVITPEQQNISISLPEDFIGKRVEVIAFTLDDIKEEIPGRERTATHFASEQSLAKDWMTPEEDKAWQDL